MVEKRIFFGFFYHMTECASIGPPYIGYVLCMKQLYLHRSFINYDNLVMSHLFWERGGQVNCLASGVILLVAHGCSSDIYSFIITQSAGF